MKIDIRYTKKELLDKAIELRERFPEEYDTICQFIRGLKGYYLMYEE